MVPGGGTVGLQVDFLFFFFFSSSFSATPLNVVTKDNLCGHLGGFGMVTWDWGPNMGVFNEPSLRELTPT